MDTQTNTFPDKLIAVLIAFTFAALSIILLFLFRIMGPAAAKPEVYNSNPVINIDGFVESALPEQNALSENAHSLARTSLPATHQNNTVNKEEFRNSENTLFSNYKNSNSKNNSAFVPDVTDEKPDNKSFFTGKYVNPHLSIPTKGIALTGREAIYLEKATDTGEEGIVVVTILVDKTGKVIQAEANGRGTNTASAQLKSKACKAALNSVFSAVTSDENQSGSIIYKFEF